MSTARKAAAAIAGGGVYVFALSAGYTYYRMVNDDARPSSFDTKNNKISTGGCAHCESSYINNPLRSTRFNSIAGSYDDEIGRDEFILGINLLRRWMLYWHARGTVLEVGAGTGRNIAYFFNNGRVNRVVLTDASPEMLQQAQRKIAELPSADQQARIAVLQTDASSLKTHDGILLPNGAFDTVLDTFGLCSYDDPVAVLKELARVCKKDTGRILLLEHGRSKTYDFINKHLDRNAEQHAANWGCVWNRDLDAILEECEKQGFLKVERKTTWHFGTTYHIICRPL